MTLHDVAVDRVEVHAFTVPTDGPDGQECDGTLCWDSTTMVLVVAPGGGRTGLGYTYADVVDDGESDRPRVVRKGR